MSRVRRAVPALVLVAAISVAAPLAAQGDAPQRRWDLFVSGGITNLSGGDSEGSVGGLGVFGVGVERPAARGRGMWRLELAVLDARADVGRSGTLDLPTEVSTMQVGAHLTRRRYGPRGGYLGIGGFLAAVVACDVDTEGGSGYFGGQTESCEAFADRNYESGAASAGLTLSAGVRRPRFDIGLRWDEGLLRTVSSDQGDMRPRHLGVIVHYRIGRPRPANAR